MTRPPRRTGEQRKPINVAPPSEDRPRMGRPTVVKLDKDEKKRGSSRTTRRLEDIEGRVSKAVDQVARAVDKGTSKYRRARAESARKRRDGALAEFVENVARGVSRGVAKGSPALVTVAKMLDTKGRRKRLRRTLKGLPRLPAIL
jgi:hypothetical protein